MVRLKNLAVKLIRLGVKFHFSANEKKNALLIYSITPFISKKNNHPSAIEIREIVSTLRNAGYKVDVVDENYLMPLNFKAYSLIIGFGALYEKSMQYDSDAIRIYYGTGAHPNYQNRAEVERVNYVKSKKNIHITPKRLVKYDLTRSICQSHAIILIGNEWTKSTYIPNTTVPIYKLNSISLQENIQVNFIKELNKEVGRYLWIGGSGLVHKGLDLCLEYFQSNKNLYLNIVGAMEQDFHKAYESELTKCKNIKFHGYMSIKSNKYKKIVDECDFVIYPTCSEGQATSLLTAMSSGLIPISTINSGVDIDVFGIKIESLTLQGVAKAVSLAESMGQCEKNLKKEAIQEYMRDNHKIITFKKDFSNILNHILLSNENKQY